jgi:hypothetical protein
MNIKVAISSVAFFTVLVAPAAGADDPRLQVCSGVPGLKLDPWPKYEPNSPMGHQADFGISVPNCKHPTSFYCSYGIGTFDSNKTRNPEGLHVRVSMLESSKDALNMLAQLLKNRGMASGGWRMFVHGPYCVRIDATGKYVARAPEIARSIDERLQALPQTCDANLATSPAPSKPEAARVTCPPSPTDQASINLSWSPGNQVRDVTIKVGTGPGADDIAIIGPIQGTSTYVNSIPPGKNIHVTLLSNFQDGTQAQTNCNVLSVGDAGIEPAMMRVYPDNFVSGAPYQRMGSTSTVATCRAACLNAANCRAFTYHVQRGGNAPYCELMAAPGKLQADSCCVAGIKTSPASGRVPIGSSPTVQLAGRWTISMRNTTDTVEIAQSGSNLTFTDSAHRSVQARMANGKIAVDAWKMQGTIEANGKQIRWDNGSVWSAAATLGDMNTYTRGPEGLERRSEAPQQPGRYDSPPPSSARADASTLVERILRECAGVRSRRDGISVALWLGDRDGNAGLLEGLPAAMTAGHAQLAAVVVEDMTLKQAAERATMNTRVRLYQDIRDVIELKNVDVVIFWGRSNRPNTLDALVVWINSMGKDAYVFAGDSVWAPTANQPGAPDGGPVGAATKYGRVVCAGNPSADDLVDFFASVRSRRFCQGAINQQR